LPEPFDDVAGILGIVAGLVGAIIVFCMRSYRILRRQSVMDEQAREQALDRQAQVLRAIQEYSSSRKFGLLRIIDSLGLTITADRVPQIWRQLLWDVQKEYVATNYIRNIYDEPWADAALAIQAAKIQERLQVRKVFIVDDERELRRCLDLFHRQESAGVQARYLLKPRLSADPDLAAALKPIEGQIDFGVFDQSLVLRWDLSPAERTVIGGAVLTVDHEVGKFREAFKSLYDKAHPLPPRLEIRPLMKKDREAIYDWPHYQAPYAELNYAIERQEGWLDQEGEIPGTIILGGFRGGELRAFSLLVPNERGSFEFFVAVRACDIGQGIGTEMTRRTVRYAFDQCGVNRVWLKVRRNHAVGRKIYLQEGFASSGFKQQLIRGKPVDFELMQQFNTRGSGSSQEASA
jgi:RimJ/RimL family protein N-acetyltransferase